MKNRAPALFSKLQKNKVIALSAAVVVAGVGVLLLQTHATGFFAAVDPESGQTSGNVAVVSDASAAGGKAVQFGSAPGGTTGSGGTLNLPRIAWDGGPAKYNEYSSFKGSKFTDPNFFPIGVWFESVLSQGDIDTDKAAGLNTYVVLTDNSNASLIRSNGMYTFDGGLSGEGSENVANMLSDEADMNYGAGWDKWTGTEGWNTCNPIQDKGGKCGYTFMQTLVNKVGTAKAAYANYGKGVAMWESDAEAQVFVNQFQQVTSDDMYFYTDPNLCSGEALNFLEVPNNQCRRAYNYGLVMDRMRTLDAMDGKTQPLYAFVEDGHPFTESTAPTINGDQLAGAVYASLIHEANGIIYFNHNFGSNCISQHVLRDSCGSAIRGRVTQVNQQISQLAPVLNTQSYQYSFNASVDSMLKEYGGSYYIFAMQKRQNNTSGTYTFTMPSGMKASRIEALFENRTITPNGNSFSDSFANEYSYHVYKITP